MKNRKNGFTIIELIVVMTIIMILAGLLVGAAQQAKARAKVAQARAMIAGIETALGMFQADMGGYPSSTNANLVSALSTVPPGAGTYTIGATNPNVSANPNYSGPYMTFKQGEITGGAVIDPWNNAYHYNNPGTDHSGTSGPNYTTYVDIWSNGPNGTDDSGAGDDIANWRR